MYSHNIIYTVDDLIKYDFWVVSPKKQVGIIVQEVS